MSSAECSPAPVLSSLLEPGAGDIPDKRTKVYVHWNTIDEGVPVQYYWFGVHEGTFLKATKDLKKVVIRSYKGSVMTVNAKSTRMLTRDARIDSDT